MQSFLDMSPFIEQVWHKQFFKIESSTHNSSHLTFFPKSVCNVWVSHNAMGSTQPLIFSITNESNIRCNLNISDVIVIMQNTFCLG